MAKQYTIAQIVEAAQEYIGEYEYIGVRTQEEEFAIGDIDHESSIWADGNETDEQLDGISVTSIKSKAIKMHSSEHDHRSGYYYGDHIAILVSNELTDMGEDEGELILRNAIVAKVLG